MSIDIADIGAQFEGLQGRHPGLWPVVPKFTLLLGIVAGICTLGYALYWTSLIEEYDAGVATEQTLRQEYTTKVAKAVNLEVLREQKLQVEKYVSILEKQLPSKSEMDALLSEINQAGVGRGAQLQLFRPGAVKVSEYYAELPIDVKLVGNYHDLAAFSSDIANLARIVTLNDVRIVKQPQGKGGQLEMQAVTKTYRYLDVHEIEEQRAIAAKLKAQQRR